jgi:hypothetical protein
MNIRRWASEARQISLCNGRENCQPADVKGATTAKRHSKLKNKSKKRRRSKATRRLVKGRVLRKRTVPRSTKVATPVKKKKKGVSERIARIRDSFATGQPSPRAKPSPQEFRDKPHAKPSPQEFRDKPHAQPSPQRWQDEPRQ